jgi:hypothetical protein
VVGRRNADTVVQVFTDFFERTDGYLPQVIMTDGYEVYETVILDTHGVWREERELAAQEEAEFDRNGMPEFYFPVEISYAKVVKVRQGSRVVAVEGEVELGSAEQLEEALEGSGHSETINTSFVERWFATRWQFNARKKRKAYTFSKDPHCHEACTWLVVVWYNIGWCVRTLRQKVQEEPPRYHHRTPAMAAGLTDHSWALGELLGYPLYQLQESPRQSKVRTYKDVLERLEGVAVGAASWPGIPTKSPPPLRPRRATMHPVATSRLRPLQEVPMFRLAFAAVLLALLPGSAAPTQSRRPFGWHPPPAMDFALAARTLNSGVDWRRRLEAAQRLGESGDMRWVPTLARAARNDPSARVRRAAGDAIAGIREANDGTVGGWPLPPADDTWGGGSWPGDPNAAMIDSWFRRYLRRSVDPGGLSARLTLLRQGADPLDIEADIIGSGEYWALNGSTVAGFVRGLYRDILQRDPNASEVRIWARRYAANRANRSAVAREFIVASEKERRLRHLP